MVRKLRVGVIFGGRSGEHEVSVRSARSVIEAIDKERYEVVPVGITKEGVWRLQSEPALTGRKLLELTAKDSGRALLTEYLTNLTATVNDKSDAAARPLSTLDADKKLLASHGLDVIFPVLHGTYGEDGAIQGLFEMKGVPYVGCGVLASACGMDKVVMKSLFREAGLPVCAYTWFLRSAWERDRGALARKVARQIGYPCFVKPANLGSSVGISRASDRASLERAVE
ncbi:MAG TPA: D-alanine--D-alanine ligase A, partial [Pyrinomonadaceae bacterium]